MNARIVNCPQCGRPVAWDTAQRHRPFCSERCRVIDLGAWASENYRIPEKQDQPGDEPAGESGTPEPPAAS